MDRHYPAIFKKVTQTITPNHDGLLRVTTRPGVYLYQNASGDVLYVGKAKNLKKRVRQYFVRTEKLSAKTQLLVPQIHTIQTIATDSELDAILLEAHLIRASKPKYNSIAKDDKSPLYIAITFDEPLPMILVTRKSTIDAWTSLKKRAVYGPFQSGRVARRLLLSLRAIIPYCTQKQRTGIPCFYTHIGLCNPCPSLIHGMPDGNSKQTLIRAYRQNLRRIALVLAGQSNIVRKELEQSMRRSAAALAYEQAADLKQQLEALKILRTHVFDPSVYTDKTSQPSDDLYAARRTDLLHVLTQAGMKLTRLRRIECMDISTIQGSWSTGSMVVFTDDLPDTREYRRFRIKQEGKPNDVGMMSEVIMRRFKHTEWLYPDLLIVDGGKPQVKAALDALTFIRSDHQRVEGSLLPNIPIIGLAKRYEEIVIPAQDLEGGLFKTIRLSASRPALQMLQHIRDEAHRFAKKYHMTLRW